MKDLWRLAALGLLLLLAACGRTDAPPRVAAAADLRLALAEVAQAFEAETGERVELVFGSSGNFHQQLMQGAPFGMFLSADEAYVESLARAGKTEDGGRLYAIGRIVLVAPLSSKLAVDSGLEGLRAALAAGEVRRFAIAHPDHAPYGLRAREALQHAGLWEALEPKLVLGENVAQAMQFAIEGGAEGGIVAWSLALDPALRGRTRQALIPEEWHAPLRQRMVLMKGAPAPLRDFYRFMATDEAQAILARYGFVVPEDEAAEAGAG